jgi:hypothetical protein
LQDLDPAVPPSPTPSDADAYVPAARCQQFPAAGRDHHPLAIKRTADAEDLVATPIVPHWAIVDRINDSAEGSFLRGTATNGKQSKEKGLRL